MAAKGFPNRYAKEIETLLGRVADDLGGDPNLDSPADMRSEAARLVSLADTMERLSDLGVEGGRALDLSNRLRTKAEALEDRANEEDEPEPDPDTEEHSSRGFDIQALFRDL